MFDNLVPYTNIHELNLDWIIKKVKEYVAKTDVLEINFEDLKKYVDDYFDNLDVQKEINNKLEEMLESGELENIIAQFLSTESLLTFNTLSDLKNANNLIDGVDVITLGTASYLDGKTALYKIRTLVSTDVVDEINIVALTNYPTLIAELINDFEPEIPEPEIPEPDHNYWTPYYFYVDAEDGSDDNTGLTINDPFKSLEKAFDMSNKGYSDLRISIIGDGTYTISHTDFAFDVLHLINPYNSNVVIEFTANADIAWYSNHINISDVTLRTQATYQMYLEGCTSRFNNVKFEGMRRLRFYGGSASLVGCTINHNIDFIWAVGELYNTSFENTDPTVSPIFVDIGSTLRVRGTLSFADLEGTSTVGALDIRRSTVYFQNAVTDTGMTNKYAYLFYLQIAILLVPTTIANTYTRCANALYDNTNSLVVNDAVQLPA